MVESESPVTVEIFLSANDLPKKDTFGKTDAFCIVYTKDSEDKVWQEIGRTEIIEKNLNPTWLKTFVISGYFERKKLIKFLIHDFDGDDTPPEFVTEVESSFQNILTNRNQSLKTKENATISIKTEEVLESYEGIEIFFKGEKLDEKDLFGKSDPYLILYRQLSDGSWAKIYKTEVVKNSINPMWNGLDVSLRKLCNSDRSKLIRVKCYDWDSFGKDYIGEGQVVLDQMLVPGFRFDLIEKKSGKKSGTIVIDQIRQKRMPYYLHDYLQAGVKISFSVAIDLPHRNVECSEPLSNHYLYGETQNPYENAISQLVPALEPFKSSKKIRTYGFSALVEGCISHCFPLNIEGKHPKNSQEIIKAYRELLPDLYPSNNSICESVINEAADLAKKPKKKACKKYHIMLIISSGQVSDIIPALRSMINASYHPLSIVVADVGGSFTDWCMFSSQDDLLHDKKGKIAKRDIMTLISCEKLRSGNEQAAAEMINRVSRQLAEYMKINGNELFIYQ